MNKKQRILIVADEPRNQRTLSEIFKDGVDVKIASTGEEALDLIETYCPDLVLLDIMTHRTNGLELCKKIKAGSELNLTKIIFVSAKAMLDEKLKGYEMGADDYITKPFMRKELLAKTKVFLRLTRVEKELERIKCSLDQQVQEKTREFLRAEEILINSSKLAALGEMAAGIAHEINTPLSVIGIIAEQVQELVGEAPANLPVIAEMNLRIGAMVQRISTIVRGIKNFSRDGGNDRLEATPWKDIVQDAIILCQEKLKSAGIKINVHQVPEDLTIRCQSVQISQVLLNLISNSSDAILPLIERWIDIAAEKREDFVQISITDSGAGIPENVLKNLFHPFFTTKEVGKGTGLGLSISKRIIEAHHGSLTVDSKCKNTRFILQIPDGGITCPDGKEFPYLNH